MDRKTTLLKSAVYLPFIAMLVLTSCSTRPEEKSVEKAASAMPSGAMPLSVVLQQVESKGYAPVVDVEFEKDHWQIKAYKDLQVIELRVGLMNGDILPTPAPPLDKPLSATVKSLEDQGFGPVIDIERKEDGSGGWEVEAYKGSSEVKVQVEAGSGEIKVK